MTLTDADLARLEALDAEIERLRAKLGRFEAMLPLDGSVYPLTTDDIRRVLADDIGKYVVVPVADLSIVPAEAELSEARAALARVKDAAPDPCATCGRPLLDHSPASSHCRGYVGDPVLVEAARRQVKEANDMRIAMGARIPKLTDRAVAAEATLARIEALCEQAVAEYQPHDVTPWVAVHELRAAMAGES